MHIGLLLFRCTYANVLRAILLQRCLVREVAWKLWIRDFSWKFLCRLCYRSSQCLSQDNTVAIRTCSFCLFQDALGWCVSRVIDTREMKIFLSDHSFEQRFVSVFGASDRIVTAVWNVRFSLRRIGRSQRSPMWSTAVWWVGTVPTFLQRVDVFY